VRRISPGGYCCKLAAGKPSAERKGGRMMPDPVVLFATIILLVRMGYFLLDGPAFLLVSPRHPACHPAAARYVQCLFPRAGPLPVSSGR
jgi:hypothetical protein